MLFNYNNYLLPNILFTVINSEFNLSHLLTCRLLAVETRLPTFSQFVHWKCIWIHEPLAEARKFKFEYIFVYNKLTR